MVYYILQKSKIVIGGVRVFEGFKGCRKCRTKSGFAMVCYKKKGFVVIGRKCENS